MKKITRKQAIEVLKRFIESELPRKKWFRQIRSKVKAIVFYGSTAKGTNRPDSDLDVLVLVPLKYEKEYTKGEYSYLFENREINIVLRSIERLKKVSRLKYDANEVEIFRKSKILHKVDNTVEKCISKIREK